MGYPPIARGNVGSTWKNAPAKAKGGFGAFEGEAQTGLNHVEEDPGLLQSNSSSGAAFWKADKYLPYATTYW